MGARVEIHFEDGTIVRGIMHSMNRHLPVTQRVGGFGPMSSEMVVEPGRLELDIWLLDAAPLPSLPNSRRTLPPTNLDDKENPAWGAYA